MIDWTLSADSVRISEQNEDKEHTIQIFTDGSKNGEGVESGTAIYEYIRSPQAATPSPQNGEGRGFGLGAIPRAGTSISH
jgi:hypothetical protein